MCYGIALLLYIQQLKQRKMEKSNILELKKKGEYQEYIEQTYETIDHEKHEEFIKNEWWNKRRLYMYEL